MRWALAYAQIAAPMNTAVGRIVEQGFEVGVARNRIVARALDLSTAPTHILFIDDDVIVNPYSLLRLLEDDLDIVGGYYFTKEHVSEPLAFLPPGEGVLPYVPNSGIHKVWGIGMGLTLIRTDVFREMAKQLDLGKDVQGNPRWFYTEGNVPGEDRTTEDLWFCRHAHEAGFDVHIDSSSHVFGWHYCKDRQVGFPEDQWNEYVKTGSMTWHVPELVEC